MLYDIESLPAIDELEAELARAGKLNAATDGGDEPDTVVTPAIIRSIDDIPPVRSFAATEIAWVVEGFLAEGSVNLLTSEPGHGKSTLSLAICGAVSSGQPFADRPTAQRRVLYLDRENPLHVVAERLDRLRIPDDDNLKVWGGWCPAEPASLTSPMILDWLRDTIPKPLVVIDSYIAYLDGDENDASVTRAFFHEVRRLANMGVTVLILHHSGKADTAKMYRGSSDIKAAVDCAFHLENVGDPARIATLRLEPFKSRFLTIPKLRFRYQDGLFLLDEQDSPHSKTNTECLAELLRGNPGIKTAEFTALATTAGLGRNRAEGFLSNGVQSGSIRQEAGKNNAKLHFWVGTASTK